MFAHQGARIHRLFAKYSASALYATRAHTRVGRCPFVLIISAVAARKAKRGIAANGLTQRNSRVIQPSCGVAGGSDGSSRGSAKFDLATFYLPEYLHIQM